MIALIDGLSLDLLAIDPQLGSVAALAGASQAKAVRGDPSILGVLSIEVQDLLPLLSSFPSTNLVLDVEVLSGNRFTPNFFFAAAILRLARFLSSAAVGFFFFFCWVIVPEPP